MGGAGSSQASRESVSLLELRDWTNEKLEDMYQRGLVDVLAALVSAFRVLVRMENVCIEIGEILSINVEDEGKQLTVMNAKTKDVMLVRPYKEVQAAKLNLDSIVHTIEAYGREFPSSLDQSSVSSIMRGMHEVLAGVTRSHKSLCELNVECFYFFLNVRESDRLTELLAILQTFRSELGVVVKEAETVCERHKAILKEMLRIKTNVLDGWDALLEDYHVLRETSRIRVDYEQTLEKYNMYKQVTQESFEDTMYDESLLLKEQTADLAAKMDRMLAPFVRISHNIKGKGKIGGPSLTDDELALIRKYTTFLSEPDLYPRIEANGSSLEDFLEALFLMGIAGGVGMDESAAKQSGFSKKSQIILAQALDNFNADELRSCYTEWRELHVRLEGIRKDKRFSEKDARVQKSSAMWLEAAKELDRICKEWQRVAPTHIRCLENFGKFQKSIAQKCQEEFGIAVELQLPEEVAVEYEDDVKGR